MPSSDDDHDDDDFGSFQSSTAPRPPLQPPSPDSQRLPDLFRSTLSYFAEPVQYTISGVVRRLSVDDAPTPLAKALSANYNGSASESMSSLYNNAPKRRLSPFQPPPLTPLSLKGYNASTTGKGRVLSKALAEEIRLLLPARLQLMDHWQLLYSLEQNGSTLSTLYSRCDNYRGKRGGFALVVRDSRGGVFGAYLTEAPKPQPHYFGSGECFLWRAVKLPALPDLSNLPPPPSEDTTHLGRMTTIGVSRTSSAASLASLNVPNGVGGPKPRPEPAESIRFKAFPYSGENDFHIFCQPEYLSVGGGDGHYGLWLDDTLSKGVSETCPTFGNEPLSEEGKKFDILGVEVWYIGS